MMSHCVSSGKGKSTLLHNYSFSNRLFSFLISLKDSVFNMSKRIY